MDGTTIDGRLELHSKLKSLITNVYFEPADGNRLSYPCIVYSRQNIENKRANNSNLYIGSMVYNVTYISRDSSNTFMKAFLKLVPSASLSNIMTVEGLYHETYNVNYRL